MALQIDSSGILLLQQVGSDVQYKSYSGVVWTDISAGQWPVTLSNTGTSLEVQFTTDLSFNSLTQYFILDSSNITIDGSSNVVNVNVANYLGLVQNGTSDASGNSYITIKNLGVESTYTLAYLGGWIGRQHFGKNAIENYVENCYSTGNIGVQSGGIFGQESSCSATNCYSTGTIHQGAGGIFGRSSQSGASATNCYSTNTIGVGAGGIFGRGSLAGANATNCYSTGPIGGIAGGIFGSDSLGSATNCYSTGLFGSNACGIFGQFSHGSATNCYCTGGTNIGVTDVSYCYAIDGSTNWLDASANDALDFSGNPWTDIDLNSETVPYLLSAFTATLYNPSSATDASNSGISIVTDCSFSIVSVNGLNPSNYTGITIDANTGDISFNSLINGVYEVNVLATNTINHGYSFGTFTNNSTTPLEASGSVLLRQQIGSDVQYSTDDGTSWTNAVWPVSLINSGSTALSARALNGDPLIVTFTDDLSFNSALQYFILDSSNITIDGSDNVVYVNVDGYPGLIQNGTIDASGNSNITIRNLGVESTYTLATSGGWLGQQYFGKNAIENYVENCYSTGTISIAAGGILGESSSSQAIATNCYSTGPISGLYAGGIFGSNSQGSATNCYSIGDIIGEQAGGIFGSFNSGLASNCHSTGDISGNNAGGIFGSDSDASASATNCYSTGEISSQCGGIFGFQSSGSASNCYSIGTIGEDAGGIFGYNSPGSAINCYSIGDIGLYAGGIFGRDSYPSASATNCYSTGTIGPRAGGIFGRGVVTITQGSATNCYSTGDIGIYAGGIFGSNSRGSATNCYSTGVIDASGGGIFGRNTTASPSATNCYCTGGTNIGGNATTTYCYSIESSANWLDASANDALDVSGNYTDIDTNSTNVPYRLSSFYINQTLYDPSGGTNVVTENPDLSGNYTWSITSVNGSTTDSSGININGATGEIIFPTLSDDTYAVNVLAVDQFGNYSFETFTNIISNICFPAGTPIVTNQGIIAINKINPAIHTIRNKKIVAITKTVSPDKYLVRFEKDALGQNLPSEATTMTQNHMLFYKGKMMKAKEFVNQDLVTKVPYKGTVLYNVLMEEHDKMVVNNLICETLHPENYVAQMYRAFKILTPKQRVEMIKQVNKVVLTEDIYKKPISKRFTFSVSK